MLLAQKIDVAEELDRLEMHQRNQQDHEEGGACDAVASTS